MIYYFVYFLTKAVSFFLFPFTAFGTENIPRQGGFILASNHVSNLDPVVLGISSVRRVNFMAKAELFKKQPLGFILTELSSFPVRRDTADFGALKEGLKRLKKGQPVLIFVEGTRRVGSEPSRAQSGAGFLAMKANVPVVPVYVKGTEKVMPPRSKTLTRGRVEVTYGKPFTVSDASSYEHASQLILDQIYKLAP